MVPVAASTRGSSPLRVFIINGLIPMAAVLLLGGILGIQTLRVRHVAEAMDTSFQRIKRAHALASLFERLGTDQQAYEVTGQIGYAESLGQSLPLVERALHNLENSGIGTQEQRGILVGIRTRAERWWQLQSSEVTDRRTGTGPLSSPAAYPSEAVRDEILSLVNRFTIAENAELASLQAEFRRESELEAAAGGVTLVGALGYFIFVSVRQALLLDRSYRDHLSLIAQLEQTESLKDQFLDMASHELRTPIQVLMSSIAIVRRRMKTAPDEVRIGNHLDKMQRAANSLWSLVSDLLDASQIEAGRFTLTPRPMDLRRAIEDVVWNLAPISEKRDLDVKVEVAEDLERVMADEQRVSQVLTNLVQNALKFTEPGGQITVRASNKGNAVRCEIIDQGIGIAPHDADRLFQRFSQVGQDPDLRSHGKGLGLYICRMLVEAHEGEIGLRSAVRQGSTFWFTLPIAPASEIRGVSDHEEQRA